jgi:hypothetical protein
MLDFFSFQNVFIKKLISIHLGCCQQPLRHSGLLRVADRAETRPMGEPQIVLEH